MEAIQKNLKRKQSTSDAENGKKAKRGRKVGSLQKCVSCLSRLAKSNCEQTRCKSCCYKSINICPLHLKEREEEVALLKHHHGIVDAPLQNRKAVPKGSFAESNIKYIGDTVTLFSIRDFFRHPSHYTETMKSERRKARTSSV